MSLNDLFRKKNDPVIDESVKKWMVDNERKGFTCQDCVYRSMSAKNVERICELSSKPVEITINGITYPIRWDKCDGYKMIRSCANCGNLHTDTIMVADRPMTIDFCQYKYNECEGNSLWISRRDYLDTISPKTIAKPEPEPIDEESEAKVEEVDIEEDIDVVDKEPEDEPAQEGISEQAEVKEAEEQRIEEVIETKEVDDMIDKVEPEEVHDEHIESVLNSITNGKRDEMPKVEIKDPEPELQPIGPKTEMTMEGQTVKVERMEPIEPTAAIEGEVIIDQEKVEEIAKGIHIDPEMTEEPKEEPKAEAEEKEEVEISTESIENVASSISIEEPIAETPVEQPIAEDKVELPTTEETPVNPVETPVNEVKTESEEVVGEDGKKFILNYNDHERLPGESRRQFKRRVRKELGLE